MTETSATPTIPSAPTASHSVSKRTAQIGVLIVATLFVGCMAVLITA